MNIKSVSGMAKNSGTLQNLDNLDRLHSSSRRPFGVWKMKMKECIWIGVLISFQKVRHSSASPSKWNTSRFWQDQHVKIGWFWMGSSFGLSRALYSDLSESWREFVHWHHGPARIEMVFIFIVMRMNDVLSEFLILYCFLILSSREKYAFRDGVQISFCVLNRVVAETEERPPNAKSKPTPRKKIFCLFSSFHLLFTHKPVLRFCRRTI